MTLPKPSTEIPVTPRQRNRTVIATLICVSLFLTLAPPASASTTYFPDDYESEFTFQDETPQWKKEVKAQWLGWGATRKVGNSIVGNYTIEVTDFQVDKEKRSVDGVLIKILDRDTGELVAQGFHRDGSSSPYINYRDDVRVKVHDVRDANAGKDEPKWEREEVQAQAKITIETRALPTPRVTAIDFSKKENMNNKIDEIFSSSELWTRITFKNNGDATLYDTEFTAEIPNQFEVLDVRDGAGKLDTSDYTLEDNTITVDWSEIESRHDDTPDDETDDWFNQGQEYKLRVKLQSPNVLQEQNFPVTGRMTGVDIKEQTYTREDQKNIKVFAVAFVFKSLTPDINPDTSQFEMYLNEEFTVQLQIRNFAKTPITINRIEDPVPTQFALPSNQTTIWTDLEVPAESSITLQYQVMPQETGTVTIPDPITNFTWTEQDATGIASSDVSTEKVVVGSGTTHGPLISVTKRVRPDRVAPGGTGNITITVKNTGDRPARITLTDEKPGSLLLLDQLPEETQILQSDDSIQTTYGFKAPAGEGNVTIPPATVKYEDIVGTTWTAFSNQPKLTISESAAPTPTENGDNGNGNGGNAGNGNDAEETPEPTPTETPAVPGPGIILMLLATALATHLKHER